MKDIVENRKRLHLGHKIRLGFLVLRENGILWTVWLGTYYAASSLAEFAFRRMSVLAQSRPLSGISSTTINREIWNNWDWQARGDEWTLSAEWKDSLVRQVLRRHIPAGKCVCEIGPGAGRWTEHLQLLAARLVGVDISQKCVDLCRKKFRACNNTEFLVTQGNRLTGVADHSIDAIWSFDVFVHINADDVDEYVREFARVMRPGGVGVVHHAKKSVHGGWRSNLTAEAFRCMLEKQGFKVEEQMENWRDGDRTWQVGRYEDVVTVFRKK
jgi:ubiquinone/menaquinone biosynthesis C-methylase UbiE